MLFCVYLTIAIMLLIIIATIAQIYVIINIYTNNKHYNQSNIRRMHGALHFSENTRYRGHEIPHEREPH